MNRRQALLLMQLTPGAILWDPKPSNLRIYLGGKGGISNLEVIGPDGEKLTFTPEEIMEALRSESPK